ncbi:hypothetical protein ENUP19_0052G0055 [Entamoeba nuttalli]|uniref:Uncharacterized protein n=1 Tax=Entamoeba nuttalli TaxID=412467 RepID=A0ABQ0DC35_9EUKA
MKYNIMIFELLFFLSVVIAGTPATRMNTGSMMPLRPFAMNQQELERQMMEEHNQNLRRLTDKYLLDESVKGSLKNANKRLWRDMRISEMEAKMQFRKQIAERGNQAQYKQAADKWKSLEMQRKMFIRYMKSANKNTVDYDSLYSMPFKEDIRFPKQKQIFKVEDGLMQGPSKSYNKWIRPDGDITADNVDTDKTYWANKYFTRH